MFRVALINSDDVTFQWENIYWSYSEAHEHLADAEAAYPSCTAEIQTLVPGDEEDTSVWVEATPVG